MKNTIQFDEASHTYTCEGKRIPSVTQILQDSKICDYGMMDKKFRDYAMKRGRYVHKATELFDDKVLDEDSLDLQIKGYVQAYINFRNELKWVLHCSERPIFHPKDRYAGTLDRVFILPDGKKIMLDIKSSASAPKWLGLQLSAYTEASAFDEEIGKVDAAVGLLLNNEGVYTLTPVITAKELKANYKVFKAAMVVAKYNGRKVDK